MLLFTHNDQQARLYILSDRDFDLGSLAAGPVEGGSGCKIEVRLASDSHHAYVIIYTGESLDAFTPPRRG
jgi:hypothetical protein